MLIIAIGIYAIAMTAANLIVSAFGPAISPINAFVLIGLDLALRDWLHVRLKMWQMGALIAVTGAITYILNPAAGMIAIASASAFIGAALVDWLVFSKLTSKPWIMRSNASNIAGAAVDSIIFPAIAFGALMPHIVVMQFVAKIAGGAIWAWLIDRTIRRHEVS
jgi:queuosine precursor transporter